MLKQLADCAAAAAVREPQRLTKTMAASPVQTTDRGPDPGASSATHVLTSIAAGGSTQVSTYAHPEKGGRDDSEKASVAIRGVPKTIITVGAAGASTSICKEPHPEKRGNDDPERDTVTSPAVCEISPKVATIRSSQGSMKASMYVPLVFTEVPPENGINVSSGKPASASSAPSQLSTKVVTVGPFGGSAKVSTQTTQVPVQANWDFVVKPGSKRGPEPKNHAAYMKVPPEVIVGINMEAERHSPPEKHSPIPSMREETVRFSSSMQMCSVCQKVFSNPSNLRQHYSIVHSASAERPFGCNVCNKRFNTESNLRQHQRTHTGERPFPCLHCSRAFSTSTNLRQHERIHTGERPFACSDCPRAFSTSSNLRQHQRIHSGERPFECSICDKRFRSSTNLRQHTRIHDGVVTTIVISEHDRLEQENNGGTRAEPTQTDHAKEHWAESERTNDGVRPDESLPRVSTVSNVEDATAIQNMHSIMFVQVSGGGVPDVFHGIQSLKEGHV